MMVCFVKEVECDFALMMSIYMLQATQKWHYRLWVGYLFPSTCRSAIFQEAKDHRFPAFIFVEGIAVSIPKPHVKGFCSLVSFAAVFLQARCLLYWTTSVHVTHSENLFSKLADLCSSSSLVLQLEITIIQIRIDELALL